MSDNNDLSGRVLQGYKIVKPIGQGKFSIVYKADHNSNIVALKKIKIFDIMDPKQREKCLKEVKLMQPLDHPNIIKYIDSFIFDNELIIITEWAEKGDLKKLIKTAMQEDNPFDEAKIWEFSLQISSALKHMHDKRIMHRDLKPANIFIAGDGNLKIGDLGLGRVFSTETIEAYSKVGTPLYMSPELLHGEGYDMKSDVWSLGCVLYELCELKSPFRDENEKMSLMDLFTKITKGEFKQINNKYSSELKKLINDMIMVDTNKRCEMGHVVKLSEEMLSSLKKANKIDCVLVMEDIYEKLTILEYQKYFCSEFKLKPVSKLFFAFKQNNENNQFEYFAGLCYWLMNLSKGMNKSSAAKTQNLIEIFEKKKNSEENSNKLVTDIKNQGIRTIEQPNPIALITGYGDSVCFLINDLLNRELIRLNYKFEVPVFEKDNDSKYDQNLEEENPDLNFLELEGEIDDYEESRIDQILQSQDFSNKILRAQTDINGWLKEVERIAPLLENLNDNQPKVQINAELDFRTNIIEIQELNKVVKDCFLDIKQRGLEDYIEKLEADLNMLNFGERRINQACEDKRDNLRSSFQNQKGLFDDLQRNANIMEERIGIHDDLTKRLSEINEKIALKEKWLSNEGDELKNLKKRKADIKEEIKNMDVRRALIENFIIKHKVSEKKRSSNKQDSDTINLDTEVLN